MKTDDIAQWAWDEATEVARAWFHEEWNNDEPQDYMQDMLVRYIAQSLAKARSQAFEEAESAVHSCASLDDNGYICEKSAAIQAIRQHSQKGRDE